MMRRKILFLLVVLTVILTAACSAQPANNLQKDISVDQAHAMYPDGAFFLDVRTPEEWKEVHIPSSTLIPLNELPTRLSEAPKDKNIIVVCRSGNRSQQGRDILLNAGWTQATSMSGGIRDWLAKGYPTEKGQ